MLALLASPTLRVRKSSIPQAFSISSKISCGVSLLPIAVKEIFLLAGILKVLLKALVNLCLRGLASSVEPSPGSSACLAYSSRSSVRGLLKLEAFSLISGEPVAISLSCNSLFWSNLALSTSFITEISLLFQSLDGVICSPKALASEPDKLVNSIALVRSFCAWYAASAFL